MSEIRSLTWSDVDKDARLQVEKSLAQNQCMVIGGFAPVETGFGLRLNVPLSEAQIDDETHDAGIFVELTFEQALDLNAKLATMLVKLASER